MNKQKKSELMINTDIVTQKNEDGIAIFDPDNSYLFTMNESATFIFERLKKGYTYVKIIQQLSSTYNISLQRAEKDILKFIQVLEKYNIIKHG